MIDLENCKRTKSIKEVKPDEELIKSLLESSENKSNSEEQLKLTKITASSKISLSYDSLRELLEALALKKGFKIYNHECYYALLNEVLEELDFAERFDELRKIRNSVNYYGKIPSIEETKLTLENIKKLKKEINNKFIR